MTRAAQPMEAAHPGVLLVQTTTPIPISDLLPRLRAGLRSAGVWLDGAHVSSVGIAELHLQLHHSAIRSLYILLIRSGLQVNRAGHIALAALCFRHRYVIGSLIQLQLQIRLAPARLSPLGQTPNLHA